MLEESVDALKVNKDGLYIDGTLGGGGHSGKILAQGGSLIAFDRDADAIAHCSEKFALNPKFAGRYTLVHQNFKTANSYMRTNLPHISQIDGAILDLGISSHQVDERSRGFSYLGDAAMDMRMDRREGLSAYDVVNSYSHSELLKILFTYGEEKNAKKIVNAMVKFREKQPIESTLQLSTIVSGCFSPFVKGGHPAKKTFQAIRIEVNKELEGLDTALIDFVGLLKKGARLSVLTFHSLEDRIVKQTFKRLAENCICDKALPICVCNNKATVKLVGKGDKPSSLEQQENTRSKSATLRVVEKL